MKLKDLIATFDRLAADTAEPQGWTPDEKIRFANQAEREACLRARLIRDNDEAGVCVASINANTTTYDYSPLIIQVLRAKLDSMTRPLIKKTAEQLDADWPAWETATGGTDYYIEDGKSRQIRFVCPVKAADTLRMHVYRYPLVDMADVDADEPEIAEQYHYGLVYWMLKLAYETQDSETGDPHKAKDYEDRFTGIFGPRPSEAQLQNWRTRAVRRTRAYFH
jgi:hypothetical protein